MQWSIEDRLLEGHRPAQTVVAYGDLDKENPSPITAAYEQQADPVIELQLEKAGVRLAYLLNAALKLQPADSRASAPVAGDRTDASLIEGADGNYYGTTVAGGLFTNSCPDGCGAVFNQ